MAGEIIYMRNSQLCTVGKHDQGVPYEANPFPHSRGYSSVRGFSARKNI